MVVWNNCNSKQVNLPGLEHWVPQTAEVSSHFSPAIHSWEVFWGNCSLAWAIFSSWMNLVFQTRCVEGISFSIAAAAFLRSELALLRSPYLDLRWPLNPKFLLWSSHNAELRSALSLFGWEELRLEAVGWTFTSLVAVICCDVVAPPSAAPCPAPSWTQVLLSPEETAPLAACLCLGLHSDMS